MKRIFFGRNGNEDYHVPFWKPWGGLSYLGRWLLFVALLCALLLLLSMFRGCGENNGGGGNGPAPVPTPTDSLPPGNIDNPGPNLPAPPDNIITPPDSTDIIDDDGREIVGNRLNVILDDPNANDDTFRQWADKFKAAYPGEQYKVTYYDPLTKLLQIEVPTNEREQIMREINVKIPDISFKVFPDGLMGPLDEDNSNRRLVPPSVAFNDPGFKEMRKYWQLATMQVFGAWAITKGNPDVVIAIVDDYFDINHDELKGEGRIVKPYSVAKRTTEVNPPRDEAIEEVAHGTMCATMALGALNNDKGTSGVAPGCRLMPISMGNDVTSMTMAQGALYAIYQGAKIVNISWGMVLEQFTGMPFEQQLAVANSMGQEEADVWDYIYKIANERKVTIVWAAGNHTAFLGIDPSKRGDACIKVSATMPDNKMTNFSNFGNWPQRGIHESTVSAPGIFLWAGQPFNDYAETQGTSFSAPLTAGVVALMKSVNPDLTTPQIIEILQSTGKSPQGVNAPFIGPIVQAGPAVMKARQMVGNGNQ